MHHWPNMELKRRELYLVPGEHHSTLTFSPLGSAHYTNVNGNSVNGPDSI